MAAQTQDYWGQFEVAEYSKPQYDETYWGQFETVNKNKEALETSLNELPKNNSYAQTMDYETEQLANLLFTKDELQAIRNKGPMGWVEYRQRNYYSWSDLIPIGGEIIRGKKGLNAQAIAEKIERGEEVSEAERAKMTNYLKDYVELQARGMSWSSKTAQGALNLPTFMLSFVLANVAGAGAQAVIKGGATAAAKMAGKAIVKSATKSVVNTATKTGIKAAVAGQITKNAGALAVLTPTYAVASYNERKLCDGLNITDKGEQFFNEDTTYSAERANEHKTANILKGIGEGAIQIGSELTGGVFGHIAGKATGLVKNSLGKVATTNVARGISATTAKVYNMLPKNTRVKLEATAKVVDKLSKAAVKTGEQWKKSGALTGFNGVGEEFAEERLADVLMVAFDLDKEKGYSVDQFLGALIPDPQQAMLELGLFTIGGSFSYASTTLADHLKNKGYSEKEAETITQNLSEIEKENMANEILGEVKINEDITEEEVKQEQESIQMKLFGGVEMNVNNAETVKENIENNEAVQRGLDKETALKQIDKLQEGHTYRINNAGVMKFTGQYNNEGMPLFESVSENKGNTQEISLTNKFDDVTENYNLEPTNFDGSKIKDKNNPLDYDYIHTQFKGVPTKQQEKVKIEMNPELEKRGNEIVKPIEIAKTDIQLNSDKKPDILNAIKQKLFEYKDGKPIPIQATNKNTNITATINANTIKESAKELLNNKDNNFIASILLNAKNIFENSELIFTNKEAKKESLKDKQIMQRYATVLNYEGTPYVAISTVKDNSKNPSKPASQPEISIYHLTGYGINNGNELGNQNAPKSDTANISIADLANFVKTRAIEKYNNDYKSLQNKKDNEFYDIEEEAPKKTEAPITQEAEKVEDELEVPETVADKIIRGESRFGKLYTEWVDRYTPIENLVKKAEQKGFKLDASSNPYFQARMYAGLVESIKQQVNDKTFVKEADGKIKITGEGFLPIINDYVEKVKDIEPNYENAIEDLSDYLIANRYLLDLKDKEGFEATEEQKLKAVEDMAKLNLKYGNKIDDISKIADRIYAFNQRILHNLVDSGNMSQETYDKIIEQNPHHISYKRVMDDNGIGQDFFAKPKFTDAKSPIKKIRGSERDIQNIFVSTLEDVARILDVAERNKVARSIADLKNILPEYIEDKKPAMEKRTAKVKVNYDAKMRQQLLEAINFFGRTFKNVKSIKTPTGYAFGSYSEEEQLIRKKLGSQDRTLAHEVGHMLDFALDIENQIKDNPAIMKEIKTLVEDRFASVIKLEDGEFVTEEGKTPEKYKRYAKTNKEAIANAIDLYFTSRDYVKRVAPETAKFIDNLFKGEYAFLNEIRPSSETAVEEIEQDVWTPSRNKPNGNIIEYFVDGKPKFIGVTKPVLDAVEGMNSQEIDFVNKFFVGSASMLRTGATITPEFAIRNFIRDQESAVIYIKNYNPFLDGVKGLFNVLGKRITGKNDTYDEWVKAGGAFGSYMELNEKSVNKALKEFVGEGSKMRSIFSYANPLKLAEEFSSIFEQATRLGMYTRSKMNGANAMQAALEAREGTLDFGRSGSLGRKYNKVLPFFNAGIQGVDKMVRAFRDHPYLSSIKAIGSITLPQLALTGYYLYFAPDDDREEYLNIPQFQKDFFYCFKVGENWIRIPKDFTLGYMFGSVPERFLIWAYQNKKPEGKDLAEMAMTLFGSVSPVNNPTDALPPIFRTAIEDIANYSFFRNQHIYPEYMNSLEPSLRANKFNSETSKLLGEKLNISPAKIDHTISSLLGTSGRYLTDAGDLMINSVREFNGEETPEKVKTLADAPFLRGFVLRDPVGYQAVSTNEFFENYKTVSEKHATYNKYKKTDREKAREYKEEHSAELKAYKKMNDTKKRISEIGKQMDKIYSDKTMTSKEKQERLQPLAKRISDMAFDANVWYGNTKE